MSGVQTQALLHIYPDGHGTPSQSSPGSFTPLGQQAPQSAPQLKHVSPESHAPFGHNGGHGPQSCGQVPQFSDELQ